MTTRPLSFFFAFIFGANSEMNAMDIPTAQADVTIRNDIMPAKESAPEIPIAMGDFNGDARDDVAVNIFNSNLNKNEVYLVMGVIGNLSLSQAYALRIISTISAPTKSNIGMGDIDGDGKDDLFVAMSHPSDNAVAVIFGRDIQGLGATIDLTLPNTPGVILVRGGFVLTNVNDPPAFAVSDWTGDGIGDLVIGCPADDGFVTIVPGRHRSDFLEILNPYTDPQSRLIKGPRHGQLGKTVFFADVIGNGRPDLILTAPNFNNETINDCGKIYVMDGGQSLPPVSEMETATQPSGIGILGANLIDRLSCVGVGDMNGDTRGDLILSASVDIDTSVLDGALLPVQGVVDLNPASPNYHAPTSVLTDFNGFKGGGGDFDGDGLKDMFVSRLNAYQLYLTSEFSSWPNFPAVINNAWLIESQTGYLKNGVFGDYNGDGYDDLIVSEVSLGETYWGATHVIFGFKPLRNPTLSFVSVAPETSRVSMNLAVEGDPREMRISGDIIDEFKDQWIPFQATWPVTLSPAAGTKVVSAMFRNAFQRESAIVEATTTLSVKADQTEVATNLVTGDQRARVDCHMTSEGRLKVSVFTRLGQRVIDLVDENRIAGHWPVEWDGTNRDGRRVVPGIYVMAIDAGNQRSRKKILVKE